MPNSFILYEKTSPVNGDTSSSIATSTKRKIVSLQAVLAGTGSISGLAHVEVSSDASHWFYSTSFNMSGTGDQSEGLVMEIPWVYVRVRIETITGTVSSFKLYANY